ncbi:hypothetical protein PGTUg99_011897 [Puccinia graminis f. sp. tritici]|uniref:Secreted protein n=1 Tax=Puccinia graminis f. sp. tritici TaxID=56615 RepID=A0A5B0M726_PUCGR|nr:hypothetical protein PGTUg99_011897 [Puccinia graminis f. sp. tritici]
MKLLSMAATLIACLSFFEGTGAAPAPSLANQLDPLDMGVAAPQLSQFQKRGDLFGQGSLEAVTGVGASETGETGETGETDDESDEDFSAED